MRVAISVLLVAMACASRAPSTPAPVASSADSDRAQVTTSLIGREPFDPARDATWAIAIAKEEIADSAFACRAGEVIWGRFFEAARRSWLLPVACSFDRPARFNDEVEVSLTTGRNFVVGRRSRRTYIAELAGFSTDFEGSRDTEFKLVLSGVDTDVDLLCELTTMEVEGYAEANLALLDLSASAAPRKLLASLPHPARHIEASLAGAALLVSARDDEGGSREYELRYANGRVDVRGRPR